MQWLRGKVVVIKTTMSILLDNSQVYFDDESHPLLFYTDNRPQTGFFVKYDASTGQYVNQGIIPAEIATPGQFPAVVNNRVFSFANSNYGSRTKGRNDF